MNRLNINYISVIPGDCQDIIKDLTVFKKVSEGYNWPYSPPAKPYRRLLFTPITVSSHISRERTMGYLERERKEGHLEWMMFDSGGFQTFRNEGYTIDRLVKENLWLYKRYDWADAYVMPDQPPAPNDTNDIIRNKIEKTILGAQTLFDQLPHKIQKKCMPVFHIQYMADIDEQYNAYKHIIEDSKLVCCAIEGGTNKRLNLKAMRVLKELKNILPKDTKIHTLGISSYPAMFALEQLGISSCDAVSPIFQASRGFLNFNGVLVKYSCRAEDPISIENLRSLKIGTGHRCPFCDNPEKLKNVWRYRRLHNLVAFDEMDLTLSNMTLDNFKMGYPEMYENLAQVLDIPTQDQQMSLF